MVQDSVARKYYIKDNYNQVKFWSYKLAISIAQTKLTSNFGETEISFCRQKTCASQIGETPP